MVMVGLCSHHIAMFDLAGGAMPYILPCFYSKTMAYRIWRCLLPHPRLYEDKSYHKEMSEGIFYKNIGEEEELFINMWTRKYMLRPMAHCRSGCL